MAVRKLHYFITNYGKDKLPDLIRLNDLRIKFLISQQEALYIRRILIDIYRQDVYDEKLLSRSIKSINNFFHNIETERVLSEKSSAKGKECENNDE